MPDLSIVSERSEADLRRTAAAYQVEGAVQQLATNILRIARGAGKPERLIDHTIAYVKAAQEFFETHGRWPVPELHGYLDIHTGFTTDDARRQAWYHGEDLMVREALQVAASRLAGQLTQERAGHTEMFEGLREIERQLDEYRKAVTQRSVKPTPRRQS